MESCWEHIGSLYALLGQWEKAGNYPERGLRLRVEIINYGDEHIEIANNMNNIGITYRHLGKFKDSEKILRKALKIKINSSRVTTEVLFSFINLANTRLFEGKYLEAEEILVKSISIADDDLSADKTFVGAFFSTLGPYILTKDDS